MKENRISIIDYGMGNIGSVINMIKKAGGIPELVSDPKGIENSDKLLLPGVGAFDAGMRNLKERNIDKVISDVVLQKKTPILGICLGMQLLLNGSEEGMLSGLKMIDGFALKFPANTGAFKIPHMGWTSVAVAKENKIIEAEKENRFYFVHSYYVECTNKTDVLGSSHYILDFVSMLQKDNIYGAQFHPEKSHKFGLQLFQNFITL